MIDLLSAPQWVVKIVLVGLIVPLVSAGITGYDRSTYAVLLPDEIVQIAGIRRSVKQLAAKYQPAMFLRSVPSHTIEKENEIKNDLSIWKSRLRSDLYPCFKAQ